MHFHFCHVVFYDITSTAQASWQPVSLSPIPYPRSLSPQRLNIRLLNVIFHYDYNVFTLQELMKWFSILMHLTESTGADAI